MASYRERIEIIEKEIAANDALIEADLRVVGKAAVAESSVPDDQDLSTLAEKAKLLDGRIGEIRESIESVHALLAERQEAKKEIDEKETDIRNHQDGLPTIFEEIGQASFDRFRDNPFVDQQYAEVFADLVKHHEEVRDVQLDLERLDSTMEQKPFLEKVVARGKRLVLANRLSAKESAQRRLFRKVGKDITRTDFISSMDDPDLTASAAPYYDTEKHIEDLTHAVENLRAKAQTIDESLAAIAGDQRPDRFVAARESDLGTQIKEQNDAYVAIGTAIADSNSASDETALVELQELRGQNEEKRAHIERLHAALRVEAIERQIERKQSSIEMSEKQLENLQKQIAEEKQSLSDLTEEKDEQEALRGPEESL